MCIFLGVNRRGSSKSHSFPEGDFDVQYGSRRNLKFYLFSLVSREGTHLASCLIGYVCFNRITASEYRPIAEVEVSVSYLKCGI
jgi:hypothetical protein